VCGSFIATSFLFLLTLLGINWGVLGYILF